MTKIKNTPKYWLKLEWGEEQNSLGHQAYGFANWDKFWAFLSKIGEITRPQSSLEDGELFDAAWDDLPHN
jgi:hypothetical protein